MVDYIVFLFGRSTRMLCCNIRILTSGIFIWMRLFSVYGFSKKWHVAPVSTTMVCNLSLVSKCCRLLC